MASRGAAPIIPYTGPRPSPARRWAPWVLATSAALAVANVVLLLLDLLERHYQQRLAAGHHVSVARIHTTLSRIHSVAVIANLVNIAFLIVVIGWSVHRRNRARLAASGEAAVEPSLWRVAPLGMTTYFVCLGCAILMSLLAHSNVHVEMTRDAIIRYRTYLVIGHAFRVVMWTAIIALVSNATDLQERREAASPGDFVSPYVAR